VIAARANKKIHPSYYNDMRLTLAASYAREGKRQKAEAELRKFQQFRQLSGDAPWTLALEAERGAFVRNSAAERHWLQSLRLAGMTEGRPTAESTKAAPKSRKSSAAVKPKTRSKGKTVRKSAAKAKPKKTQPKKGTRKAPKRKSAKRATPKRKTAKRKATKRKTASRAKPRSKR
jgi:hypothetical protein